MHRAGQAPCLGVPVTSSVGPIAEVHPWRATHLSRIRSLAVCHEAVRLQPSSRAVTVSTCQSHSQTKLRLPHGCRAPQPAGRPSCGGRRTGGGGAAERGRRTSSRGAAWSPRNPSPRLACIRATYSSPTHRPGTACPTLHSSGPAYGRPLSFTLGGRIQAHAICSSPERTNEVDPCCPLDCCDRRHRLRHIEADHRTERKACLLRKVRLCKS